MKNIIITCTIVFFGLCLLAFTVTNDVKNSTAEVDQIQGLYAFIHSKPVNEYEYLGSIAPKLVPSKNASSIINHMIKKGKEKYPNADGIVFTDDALAKVDLIKFK